MQRFLTVLLFTLAVGTAKSQLVDDSLLIEGHYRVFHFLKPAKSGSTLIFALHGSGGNGLGVRTGAKKLEEIAPAENILLVYPDGYKRYWNECRKTAQSAANMENINENAFFGQMIDYFSTKYQIDTKRIFAVGTSGGWTYGV
jgi:polyhydroxybutyrate depolymerase